MRNRSEINGTQGAPLPRTHRHGRPERNFPPAVGSECGCRNNATRACTESIGGAIAN